MRRRCLRSPDPTSKKIYLAMSDRLSDLELKLKRVVTAVKDVTEWYDLGLQLGLPDSTLRLIADNHDVKGRTRSMLSEWLQYDPGASWEKLAGALTTIGKNVVAANIRSQFVRAAATCGLELSTDDDKICKRGYCQIVSPKSGPPGLSTTE